MQAISESSDDDVQKALHLELPNETALWRGLEQFRADFTQRSSQETVFNPQHLLKAFALYNSQFGTWSWNQRDLFWRQVIGFTQRFLPANTAMDFAQGLYHRVERKEKSRRSFNFAFDGSSIFPLSFDSFLGLGYEFGVAPHYELAPRRRAWLSFRTGAAELVQNLCRAKTAILGELCSQSRPAAIEATV